jgi:hypothetical protein
VVVVDTDSSFVYIGTLKEVDGEFVTLVNVDAHDIREAKSTKEQYVIDTKKYGVNPNRKEARLRKALIVSVSRLSDVVEY